MLPSDIQYAAHGCIHITKSCASQHPAALCMTCRAILLIPIIAFYCSLFCCISIIYTFLPFYNREIKIFASHSIRSIRFLIPLFQMLQDPKCNRPEDHVNTIPQRPANDIRDQIRNIR